MLLAAVDFRDCTKPVQQKEITRETNTDVTTKKANRYESMSHTVKILGSNVVKLRFYQMLRCMQAGKETRRKPLSPQNIPYAPSTPRLLKGSEYK